jgi:hypothetical protein
LSLMQSESERTSWSSENRADGFRRSAESAPVSGRADASHEREGTEGAPQAVQMKIGSPQWWAAVVLYSFVVVALVIGFSSLSHLV